MKLKFQLGEPSKEMMKLKSNYDAFNKLMTNMEMKMKMIMIY